MGRGTGLIEVDDPLSPGIKCCGLTIPVQDSMVPALEAVNLFPPSNEARAMVPIPWADRTRNFRLSCSRQVW